MNLNLSKAPDISRQARCLLCVSASCWLPATGLWGIVFTRGLLYSEEINLVRYRISECRRLVHPQNFKLILFLSGPLAWRQRLSSPLIQEKWTSLVKMLSPLPGCLLSWKILTSPWSREDVGGPGQRWGCGTMGPLLGLLREGAECGFTVVVLLLVGFLSCNYNSLSCSSAPGCR